MPFDDFLHGLQQPSQSGRPFQSRVNELKHVVSRQPGKGLAGLTFRQHVKELSRKASRREAVQESHFHGFRQEDGRVPVELKTPSVAQTEWRGTRESGRR